LYLLKKAQEKPHIANKKIADISQTDDQNGSSSIEVSIALIEESNGFFRLFDLMPHKHKRDRFSLLD
jgi:hypothetical protein